MKSKAKRLLSFCSVIGIILGFVFGLFFWKTLTTDDVENFKSIAHWIFDQEEHIIVEVPDNANVYFTNTSITITSKDFRCFGSVSAVLRNGDLVFTTDSGLSDKIFLVCLSSFVFGLICFYLQYLWIRSRQSKKISSG